MKFESQMPASNFITDGEYVPCVVCDRMNHTLFFNRRDLPDNDLTYSQGMPQPLTSQVVRCNNCGLLFVNPRKKMEEITSGYSKAEELGYSSQWKQRMRTFKRKLRLIERLKTRGSVVDVGCASGVFLYVARRSGWRTFGVELNEKLANVGKRKRGIDIFNGRLEDAGIPESSYDVATLFDVIEHLPQPFKTLRIIHSILGDNGLLVVNFPDVKSFTARIFGRKWWFFLEDHLYYFSPRTLSLLLKRANFDILLVKNHFQSLELGYLLKMCSAYEPKIASLLKRLAHLLSLDGMAITYSAGQKTVIARKISKGRECQK